ncbi:MAG: hypothetical protein A2010_15575 [Nitrospirae bacterium GWD2_57_9]|nr:MAG: hypothetical protein A2010_15575 [Nitrospirae bacterium GWD2_57_9]OGW48118.1 MAG: hypothetical protein A2078_00660 [Nitrospirae bacterium GWC2_57_9]
MNESELFGSVEGGQCSLGNSTAEFGPEIEMVTAATEQAVSDDQVPERRLAHTGRTDQQHRIDGKLKPPGERQGTS